jgi:hypothetical protein
LRAAERRLAKLNATVAVVGVDPAFRDIVVTVREK